MSRKYHSFGRMLLQGLIMFCLALAAPLVILILIQVSGLAGPQFLYRNGAFLGDRMLIAVGGLLGVALLAGVTLGLLALKRTEPPWRGRPISDVAAGEYHANSSAAELSPELTFHQCAMKIQFKLTHLEEKVNELETVLMRRAADPE